MSDYYPVFPVYKGLQRPLIFKGFKGKFIYIGAACIVGSIIISAIISSLVSFLFGAISLFIVLFGGLFLTSHLQKNGLHKKDKRKGVYIVTHTFYRNTK